MIRRLLSALTFALSLAGIAHAGEAPVYQGGSLFGEKLAVNGYDPVAYFTDGKPVEGTDEFTLEWNGAKWRFVSAANRDAFKAEPEKYAPQFGGYCAWAVAQGYTASADPEAWKIVEGKLYLNYDKSVQKTWEEDVPGNITKAEANWPKVLE